MRSTEPDLGRSRLAPGVLEPWEVDRYRLDPIGFVERRHLRYGRVFKTHLGAPTAFLIGPDANRFMLRDDPMLFSVGGAWPPYLRFMLGDAALSMQDGQDYRRLRSLVAPAFAPTVLRTMVGWMQQAAEEHIERWSVSGPVRLLPLARALVLAVITRWAVGVPDDDVEARALAACTDAFTEVPPRRHEGRLGWQQSQVTVSERYRKVMARRLLERYLEDVIARRRCEPSDDAVGLMCRQDEGGAYSDAEITAQALMMLSAGTDSTASTLTWLVHALDQHPGVRRRLAAEVAEVVGGDPLTWQQLPRMPYLQAVIKEVERMHPVALAPARVALDDFEFDDLVVPRDWIVRYCIPLTHRSPEAFADPEKFDPDRFLPPRQEDKRTPCALVGFGSGPRHCLGKPLAQLFLQVFTVTLLQCAEWATLPGQDVRPVLDNNTTLKPRSRLWVQFVPLADGAAARRGPRFGMRAPVST